ncbi:MAG: hypothetical protein KGD63_02390 [Candidatus Lokiarchaeota archaeon]|nr:hypothetical protein [Candidatus Lokiarchaeota archaeon]
MDEIFKSSFSNLKENLNFINISSKNMTLFEWKPPRSFRSYILDVNFVKEYATDSIFFHLHKGNSKLVHIKKGDLIYTIGANNNIQYQLLEAIIEYVDYKFNDIYDIKVILSFENVSTNIFRNFSSIVDELLGDFRKLDLVKTINARCRVCNKILPIFVKKSFIENSEDFPVPLVYSHKGHAILLFIDRNFDVRGVELVNTTA